MRRYVLLVAVSLLFATRPLYGQTLFVSTFNYNQVVRIDAASGRQTVIYQGQFSFLPEGIVVGPDGRVYVCDSLGSQILRMNQDGTEVETVYRPQLFTEPSGPEGPSFLGADLYFNTRGSGATHTGVWKIAGVAALAFSGNFPRPVLTVPRSQTGSSFGEGTIFTTPSGDLLVVDRSNSRVLKASPPYTTATPFITSNLNEPFGIVVTGKEIWVASGGGFQWNINRYDAINGQYLGTLAVFQNGFPIFMDLDAAGNLYVTEAGGNVWVRNPAGVWRLVASLPEAVGINLGKTAGCTITGRGQACLLEAIAFDPLGSRIPLILIHGWQLRGMPADPSPGSWEKFTNYFFLNQQLREKYKLYYFSYYSNEVNVPTLAAILRDLIDQKGQVDSAFSASPLVFDAHSMGGLVGRSLMQQFKFRYGSWASRFAGERTLRLITRGTPHHGSPLANKEARNAKVATIFQPSLTLVELAISPQPNESNRSDILWDNYDGLYEDRLYQKEPNEWLKTLNASTLYDSKIVAYTGSVIVGQNCETFFYCHGSTILGSAMGMASDGVVPVVSAGFYSGTIGQGSPRVLTRPFENYNHEDMVRGKTDNVLFNRIRDDLLSVTTTAVSQVPFVSIDSPSEGAIVAGVISVGGWALHNAALSGTGVDAVHLYLDGLAGGGGVPIAAATYGLDRPDLVPVFGPRYQYAGFSYNWDTSAISPGFHTLYVYAHSTVTGWSVFTRTFTKAAVGPVLLAIDWPQSNAVVSGVVRVAGWAIHPDAPSSTGVDAVHLYLDGLAGQGQGIAPAVYGLDRPDVAAAFGNQRFRFSGYAFDWNTVGLSPGSHTLYVYVHSTLSGWSYFTRPIRK